jgi:tricorn protease
MPSAWMIGDALSWYFRRLGLGPIDGKRTMRTLLAALNIPELMDGTLVEIPNTAPYGLSGDLGVENRGVAPDREVELNPAAVRLGIDPQLDAAIDVVIKALRKTPADEPRPLKTPTFSK